VADGYGLAGLWKVGMVQVRECMNTLNALMKANTPKVLVVLDEHGIPPITYVPQFFMTGFLYNLPFDVVVRIWDSFWLRRFDFFYAVAVSIFKISQPVILKFEMEEMMNFLKFRDGDRPIDFTAEQLVDTAVHVFQKFKPQQLRQWEMEARELITGKKMEQKQQANRKATGSLRQAVKRAPRSFTHAASEELNLRKHTRKTRKSSVADEEPRNFHQSASLSAVNGDEERSTRKKKKPKGQRTNRSQSEKNVKEEI